jgi:hypothetical protein
MLFSFHSDLANGGKDFFVMNPGAQAIEEFNNCTSRQMFFVGLVADRDYDSPLRTLPEKTRRERAVIVSGYPMEGDRPDKNARNLINRKVEAVEKAIFKYREMQYDEDKAMLEAINMQIQETLDAMSLDKREAAKVVKIKTEKKSGDTEKIEFVDAKLLQALRLGATKLGAELPALRAAKKKLQETVNSASPISNIITYSSSDLPDEPLSNEGEIGSTLDRFNEERFKKE